MKLPWISRRKHEELLVADREWTMMSARTHFTFAMRESAREGYKVGYEAGLKASGSNE